jgi:amino acid transporter
MTQLARKLRLVDYFTLGFGTMVGVGWLIVMDDWLGRGGPLGAILGFAIGGGALLPIGYVYGRLVRAMPDAASEIAYTARVFPTSVSFATGWMMLLAYFIVCPWEAVAIGRVAAYLFPALDSFEIYRLADRPVFLPHVAAGLALTALVTSLNYRGIRVSASFQKWTTFGVLSLFVVFVSCGAARGSPQNLAPLFSRGRLVSILLVLQIVPYFMTGFESVAKCAEEATPDFPSRDYSRAIFAALAAGIVFYTAVIAAVAYVSPWPALTTERFATAAAFERAFRSRWVVNAVLAAALLSLLKVFNGNFVAASRLLFALGRRGLVTARLGRIHPRNQTPSVAVLHVGLATAVMMFFGSAILIPITEVGSVASAAGWLAACAAYYRMRPGRTERACAAAGAGVASLLVLMKIFPFVPGHFSAYEYAALGVWGLGGLALRWREARLAKPAGDRA